MRIDGKLKTAGVCLVDYRVYALNERNRILGSARPVRAVSDERAIEMTAEQFPDEHAMELWEGDRLVFRITPNKSNFVWPLGAPARPLFA